MKRYGNIYEKICDKQNLLLAHQNAKRDKGFYKDVQEVEEDLENKINEIHDMLANQTYQVGEYKISVINDKGKDRVLHKLPYFPDRIIQWAILLQIEPIFMNVFENFSCASIKERGIHYATNLLTSYMKDDFNGTQYCLKTDVKKFYFNINRKILKQLLRKKFKDDKLLWLLDLIIDSMDDCDLTDVNIPKEQKDLLSRPNKGIPIGSYLSQFLANYYLSYFDHWLKECLHIKYVIRYMDDVVILSKSKDELHKNFNLIREYLHDNLDLEIKDNWQIFPTAIRGIDFVGYRHYYGYRLLRKTTYLRYKKRMIFIKKYFDMGFPLDESLWCSYMSYIGWLSWCNSYTLFCKYGKDLMNEVNYYYHDEIGGKKKNIISMKIFLKNLNKNKVNWNEKYTRKPIHPKEE